MASHSLLDLVCQLQNFETKISEIVMEMAIKLSGLNDTKLLLILSTATGRKVAGSPDLCQQFFQHELATDGSETYLEYDHGRNIMVEVPLLSDNQHQNTEHPNLPVFPCYEESHSPSSHNSHHTVSKATRKRSSRDNTPVEGSSTKSPRIDSFGSLETWNTGDQSEPDYQVTQNFEEADEKVSTDPKNMVLVPLISNNSNPFATPPKPANGSSAKTPRNRPLGISRISIIKYDLPEDVKKQMEDFFEDDQYAAAFLECDPTLILNRDSKEHKILTSLIMQYAKFCAPHVPPDKAERTSFSNKAFEIFWAHFPQLHGIENHVINNGHQNYSVKSYCKSRYSGRMYNIASRDSFRSPNFKTMMMCLTDAPSFPDSSPS